MDKVMKSVKIDKDLNETIERYASLIKSIYGIAPTFTSMVENGICMYLLDQINLMKTAAQSGVVMENGTLKALQVSKDQQSALEELKAKLLSGHSDYI
ncbi:MAG: hypothetical protein IKY21_03990 [Clostridia bacterium]|nr:hypothetical protein [Clostridia bacterium]